MTTEQKNSYLEAHMEVQQHIQQVSVQVNKQNQNQSSASSHSQNLLGNHIVGSTHQTSSSIHASNNYLNANPIKVIIVLFDCYLNKI